MIRPALLAGTLFFAGTTAILAPALTQYGPVQVTGDDIRVTDGDTLRIGRTRVRLVGFDAPELFHPRCMAEHALAVTAKARMEAIISGGGINLTFVPCACAPGTEGSKHCNFGRSCAVLTSHGENVAELMIRDKLARRYVCGEQSCPRREDWCP